MLNAATGLSARVASHIAETTFDQLPPAVVSVTKAAFVDAIGVMLAAMALGEGCRAFTELAVQVCDLLCGKGRDPIFASVFCPDDDDLVPIPVTSAPGVFSK